MLNLDTHILLYAVAGDLKPAERTLLENDEWSVSAIVLWEIVTLVRLGRIELDPSEQDFRRLIDGLHIWPLSLDIAICTASLDFRADPADEIIGATSIIHRVPLLTRNRSIRKSKLVPFA